MAKVLKCDICGRCYPYPKNCDEINRIEFHNFRIVGTLFIEHFDVCPDCVEAIKKTIEERMDQSLEEA